MRKTAYLVRHGESEGNVGTVYQGPDSPLTEKGREQAQFLAKRIKNLQFDALLASPWARAKETAQIISAQTGKDVEFSELFVERRKPASLNDMAHADPDAKALNDEWVKSLFTPGYRVQDGENFDDLMLRARQALDFLEARPEDTLVVATHGFFLRTIVAYVLIGEAISGDAFRHFIYTTSTKNTGVTVIEFSDDYDDPRWRLRVLNDHAHLAEPA